MKRSLQALVVTCFCGLSAPALAQDAAKAEVPAQNQKKTEKEKRWSIARDLTAAVPVGTIAADSGPMIGALVRLGYQATRELEVAIRAGYLYGLDKEISPGQVTALSSVPFVASARWFFAAKLFGAGVGPYGGLEGGANLLRRRYRTTAESGLFELDFDARENEWTAGATAFVGWVLTRKVPIDLRAQVAAIDLFSGRGAVDAIAVGGSAGWTIWF